MANCIRCGIEFTPRRAGHRFCGKICSHDDWVDRNAERVAEKRRERERKPEVRAKRKPWIEANAEHLREYKHQHYLENKADYIARAKAQAENHPVRVHGYKRKHAKTPKGQESIYNGVRRRLARKANSPGGNFTKAEFNLLCAEYDDHCLGCCKPFPRCDLEADHVVALAKGGSDDIGNIQPLCRNCNAQKSAKHIDFRITFRSRSVKKEPDK